MISQNPIDSFRRDEGIAHSLCMQQQYSLALLLIYFMASFPFFSDRDTERDTHVSECGVFCESKKEKEEIRIYI